MEKIAEFIRSVNESTASVFEGGIFTALAVWAVILIAAPAALRLLKRANRKMDEKKLRRTSPIVRHMIKAVIVLLAVFGVLLQVIPLKSVVVSVFATSGVIAVVLSLASQQAVSGFVSGLFITVFKPFVIGDRITIPAVKITGIVEDITVYHTIIRSLQNNRIVIPNSLMNGYVVENETKVENSCCNYLNVQISYKSDIDKAIAVMREICESHPDCIDMRNEQSVGSKVEVRVTELGSSGVELRAFVWSENAAAGFNMLCDLRKSVKKAFEEQGIEIPFPTSNVIIRNE